MKNICVKLSQRGNNNKYRKMLSSKESIFPEFDPKNISAYQYNPDSALQDEDYYYVTNIKEKEYSIDLFSHTFTTVDFEMLVHSEFSQIDYLFVLDEQFIFFQNVTKSKLVSKKKIIILEKSLLIKQIVRKLS